MFMQTKIWHLLTTLSENAMFRLMVIWHLSTTLSENAIDLRGIYPRPCQKMPSIYVAFIDEVGINAMTKIAYILGKSL